jgi:catechol 2,3-dioxygenase-like lactoylglutathione lyase family enzyme
MTFRLDHVVIAVAELARTIEDYRSLGFNVVIGGRHSTSTSHNALVAFADGAYLELIAWQGPDPAHRWYGVHAKHGDGLMDFALLPLDTTDAVAAAKSRGLAIEGPIDGGRVRPDGRELKWQTARQATHDLPFLCGDVTPRELRVPPGEAHRHANGVQGVASVAVAVHDIEVSRARYRALLGAEANVGSPVVLAGLGIRIAVVAIGESALVLQTPACPASTDETAPARELRERLATRGEGPCGLALRTIAASKGLTLDRSRTHGVPLELGTWPTAAA